MGNQAPLTVVLRGMTLQRFSLGVACGVFACVFGAGNGLTAQTQGRKLDVSFNNGNVTILAENVTLREIMAEWGRKGGSRIVNAEKLGGTAIPYIEFKDQPEVVVLRSLLRDVPGYGAAPRIAPAANASSLEAVFILATRAVPVSGASAAPPAAQPIQQATPPPAQQFEPPPQPAPRVIEGSPDSQLPPVRPVAGELPPTTPGGTPASNNPNLRPGPGGTVTSTIPGVVIPGAPTPTAPPPPGGRGRRGGGGGSL
jgi:hypothetical protein